MIINHLGKILEVPLFIYELHNYTFELKKHYILNASIQQIRL